MFTLWSQWLHVNSLSFPDFQPLLASARVDIKMIILILTHLPFLGTNLTWWLFNREDFIFWKSKGRPLNRYHLSILDRLHSLAVFVSHWWMLIFCGPHLIITGRRATTGCNRKTKPQATAKNCGYYDIEKEEISRDKYQRDKEKGITNCLDGHPLRKRDERWLNRQTWIIIATSHLQDFTWPILQTISKKPRIRKPSANC